MTWASILPIFSFLSPFILHLASGTGQTDRQTDRQTDNGHQRIAGGGGIKRQAGGHNTEYLFASLNTKRKRVSLS